MLLIRQYNRDRYVEHSDSTSRRAMLEVLGQSLCAECGTLLMRDVPTVTTLAPEYAELAGDRFIAVPGGNEYAVTVCLDCAPAIVARLTEARDRAKEPPAPVHTVNGKSDGPWAYGVTHDYDCPGCEGSNFLTSPRSETYWSS